MVLSKCAVFAEEVFSGPSLHDHCIHYVFIESCQVSLRVCDSEVKAPTHIFLSEVHEQSAEMLLLCHLKSSTEAAESSRATFRQKKQQMTTLALGCLFSLKAYI